MFNQRSAILLAAGQGNRLRPLTEGIPKCLLPIGNKTIIDTILPNLLTETDREVVVVAGYSAESLEAHVKNHYPTGRIKIVHNTNYIEDVNILSTDIGVDALKKPELGYTFIETDILLEPSAWQVIHGAEKTQNSFWVTSGRYNTSLTGGIVHVSAANHAVDHIAYVPEYDKAYEGWHKMVGILSVSPDQVNSDRRHRKTAIRESCAQYYMMPWIRHAKDLPCIAVDLADLYVRSFNTISDYAPACLEYSKLFPEVTS